MHPHPEDQHPPLGFMIVRIAEALDRRFVVALADLGLRPRDLRLLVLVSRTRNLNQRELARQLDVDPGNLIAALEPLESDGILERPRNPSDRRQRMVTLTPTGERVLADALRATASVDASVLTTLSPSEQRAYYNATLAIHLRL